MTDCSKEIKVITITFSNEISAHEIPLFRGAIIARMQGEAHVLYHNHSDDTSYRYSYPLVQYKRIGRKAAIVGIDDGATVMGQLLDSGINGIYQLGARDIVMEVQSMVPTHTRMQVWNDTFHYTLRHWLPLNANNYRTYTSLTSLTERVQLLERILRGNLLSMCKGLGVFLDKELTASITSLEPPRIVRNKGVALMSFDLEFTSNLSIPNGLGLGKNASLGYGTVFAKRKERTNKTNISTNNE